ncbi:Hsp20/alpha crystallin family protein [Silvibacterium acidisoli]|uniref:Hsp20/alpha crystallin family protein n=1 Tax=Acidobacteriaceae bacterium ZG23-2 TaxID=2883246 RepID=UPI00406C3BEC
MAITRFAPYRDVVSLQNRLNSLFQDFNQSQAGTDPVVAAAFVPPVDVYEDEHKVVLKLEVPGLKREEIDIQLDNHTLTVRGERKFEKEEKQENFHRIERRYGSFYRSFTLPNTLNTEQVKADYDAGVLRVEVEKRAEAKPRQIKVEVGSAAPRVENQPAA